MSDLAFEILEYFKSNYQLNYNEDASIKCQQIKAINELVDNGYLVVETRTNSYIICEVI